MKRKTITPKRKIQLRISDIIGILKGTPEEAEAMKRHLKEMREQAGKDGQARMLKLERQHKTNLHRKAY